VTTTGIQFDTFNTEFLANPRPLYASLREAGRVLWMSPMGGEVQTGPPDDATMPGGWIVSHYDDCMMLLRDERLSADPKRSQLFHMMMRMVWGEDSPALNLMKNLLLFMDPPDHTRLRSLANAAFSRKAVEELRPRIEQIVDELLATAREKDTIDLVTEFAYPFPITVIAEMLGIPLSDRELFGGWAHDLINLFATDRASEENSKIGNDAILSLNAYFTDLGNERRQQPRNDLLTALVEVEEEGERLSHEEYVALCLILLIAGHETTANLIGLGTNALLDQPDALQRLRDDRSLVGSAVEELLRYDSPVQATARTTLAEITIGDVTIPEAERVMVLVGSANHDPAKFHDPDEIILDRGSNPFLSFGGGIHFCLGAPLARLEARVAFDRLTSGPLERAGDVEWRPTYPIKGLSSLPVSLS
jgi:pimeloyl-[acyl-carrier protein] synthase